MKKLYLQILACFFILSSCFLLNSCADSVEPVSNNLFYQKSGCLGKIIEGDSCFSYVFNEKLTVEFCVSSNCCPDSNRYIFQQEITADTINLFVEDIEEHLCHCTCKYLLHSETHGLLLNSYQYNVFLKVSTGKELLYSKRVFRDIK